MKGIKLRMKEQLKYDAIKEYVDHGGNKTRIAKKLNLTIRQVNRLIKLYNEKGKSGFVHGNRLKKPINKLDDSLSNSIILLYRNKYQDFNFCHFKDYLEEDEGIKVSYYYIYNLLMKNDIISPRIRKKTKKKIAKEKLLKEKQLENKTEEEIEILVSHEVALEDSHPRGERPKYIGENIEMDGSIHLWFGNRKTCLHLAADEATNTIVGGYFDYQETLNGYYHVFKQILLNYGIPYRFTTDNRTVFNYMSLNPDKRTEEKDVLTQFGYACQKLGVDLVTTSVSQAKGLIERDNGTFQGRLVNELKLNNITTIEEANNYLINIFIPKFNKKFALDMNKFQSVYEEVLSEEEINNILVIRAIRKVDNGNAIKYFNEYYQPYESNNLICIKPKSECTIIKTFDNKLKLEIDGKIYELRKLSRNMIISSEIDIITPKEQVAHIPSSSHPWRKGFYTPYYKKTHA